MGDMSAGFEFALATPPLAGPVAVIDVHGDLSAMWNSLGPGAGRLQVGEVRLRDFWGIDRGLVAVLGTNRAQIMPHGGIRIVERIMEQLRACGGALKSELDPEVAYPEAEDRDEALMLAAAARMESAIGLDLLLEQPSRWKAWRSGSEWSKSWDLIESHAACLRYLLTPARIVLVGAANIGKSTLTNALAMRPASITSASPGTTRDFVGVPMDFEGLAAWWFDTPGRRPTADPIEREAIALSDDLIGSADLIVLASDPRNREVDLPAGVGSEVPRIRVFLRADLDECEGFGVPCGGGGEVGLKVCAPKQEGLIELRRLIREALVPPDAVASPLPWLFDSRLR